MKKIVCILIVAVISIAAAGCSGKEDTKEQAGGMTSSEILDKIIPTQTGFPDSLREDSTDPDGKEKDDWKENFGYLFDFDAEKVKDFAIIYSTETTADEITVVRLKDNADIKELEESMKKRLEKRTATFENYGPEEVSKLKKAVIKTVGCYGVLIISSQPSEGEKAFSDTAKTSVNGAVL